MTSTDNQMQEVDKRLVEKAVPILDMIAEGKDESEACKAVGIRRGTLVQWMIKYPEFDNAMKEAKKMRADTYRSKVQESLFDESGDLVYLSKEDVPGQKLNFDKLKWLAEMDNPEKYGARIKHEGDVISPVQIVIDTGIRQVEDKADTIEDAEYIMTDDEDLL